MARTDLTVRITGTDEVVRMISQAIHDAFLPGTDGHDMCNHSGGAREVIRRWARERGIELEDTMPEHPNPRRVRP